MPGKQWVGYSVPVIAGKLSSKEPLMSILRVAVENHLLRNRMTIRQLISAAYYKKHSKEMPEKALDDEVRRWESGCNDIPVLYDLMFQVHT